MVKLLLVCVVLLAVSLWMIEQAEGDSVRFGIVVEKGTVLGDIDQTLIDGFYMWKSWTEQHGGLQIGGENLTIELIIEIAAENISDDTSDDIRKPLMQNATRKLLTENSIDALLGPFGTIRTLWVMEEKFNVVGDSIPFLVVGGGGASIFQQGHTNLWSNSAVGPDLQKIIIELVVNASILFDDKPVQTVSLIGKQDGAFYESSYNLILPLLQNRSDVDLVFSDLYPSTLQTEDLANSNQLMDPLTAANARATILSGGIAQDSQTIAFLFKSYGYTPSLFAITSPVDSFDVSVYQVISPEYWVYATSFHPDAGYGVPDRYLGLSKDYPALYEQLFNAPFTNLRLPQASALCVAWQLGAQRAGANWRNSTDFIASMLSLRRNDSSTETFCGRWQFTPVGQNEAKESFYIQFQYVDDVLSPVLIKTAADLIYPAPWSWKEDDDGDNDLDTEATVGIVIGSLAAFVLLLIVVAAIGAVLFFVAKSKFFHLIFLPKGGSIKEEEGL